MLNKKGFARIDDLTAFIIGAILIVAALFLLGTYLKAVDVVQVQEARNSFNGIEPQSLQAVDAAFLDTDLLTLLQYPVEELTVGEIIALSPSFYPQENDELYAKELLYRGSSDIPHCDTKLFEQIATQLNTITEGQWGLHAYTPEGEEVFRCVSQGGGDDVTTDILLPSINGDVLTVVIGVEQ